MMMVKSPTRMFGRAPGRSGSHNERHGTSGPVPAVSFVVIVTMTVTAWPGLPGCQCQTRSRLGRQAPAPRPPWPGGHRGAPGGARRDDRKSE